MRSGETVGVKTAAPATPEPPQIRTPRSSLLLLIVVLGLAAAVIVPVTVSLITGEDEVAPAEPCPGGEPSCFKDRVSGPNDPCRFIRTTDAEKVLGVDFGAYPGRAENTCFLPSWSFSVVTREGESAYRSAVRSLEDRFLLGSESYWDAEMGTLHVLVGDSYLVINGIVGPGAREKAIALAGLALAKIAPAPEPAG